MIARSTHFTSLGHNRRKLCLLMGQVMHLVPFNFIHSIMRTKPKNKCTKLQMKGEKILFLANVRILRQMAQRHFLFKKDKSDRKDS